MSLPFSQLEEGVPATGDGESLGRDGDSSEEAKSVSPKTPSRPILFSDEQRIILIRYFDEYGMTSTHRRNTDLMTKCAGEVGTTIERVKNWIGSESVKRKRKAGILPRPKVEMSGSIPLVRLQDPSPATKKMKRVNGYNVFFSYYVKNNPTLTSDLKQRNILVAQKWAELTDEERKIWSIKAEAMCENTTYVEPEITMETAQEPDSPEVPTSSLIESTLMKIQEKFDLLQQLGFEGYAILINTNELQSHLIATNKGKNYQRARQKQGKPLENPFIGYVFSEEGEDLQARSDQISVRTQPQTNLETLQRSVAGAFALKYKLASGKTDIPYDSLQTLGYHVIGMPPGIPMMNPLLYSEQQLHQVLANLDKIVFLRVPQTARDLTDLPASLLSGPDVEISASH
jgi:hypothetical protein